jgi:hypothetical protein
MPRIQVAPGSTDRGGELVNLSRSYPGPLLGTAAATIDGVGRVFMIDATSQGKPGFNVVTIRDGQPPKSIFRENARRAAVAMHHEAERMRAEKVRR